MDLSILIPSVPSRLPKLTTLIATLERQIGDRPVELLVHLDNKKRTIGAKRNDLLDRARGRYVTFVDDDDTVADDYVVTILDYITKHPQAECFVYDVMVQSSSGDRLCRYGIEYDWLDTTTMYYRSPSHLSVFRREVAQQVRYEDLSFGEDRRYPQALKHFITAQVRIPATLYTYHFEPRPKSWYSGGPWTSYYDIVEWLVKQQQCSTYLELGSSLFGHYYSQITAPNKYDDDVRANYDVVVIDGDHDHRLVDQQIDHYLSKARLLLVLNTNPTEERYANYPHRGENVWYGDVYRSIMALRSRTGVQLVTFATSPGITLIRTGNNESPMTDQPATWNNFYSARHEILQIRSEEEIKSWLVNG